MTYTYDDFVTAANRAGLMDQFGEDDLRIARQSPEYGLSALKLTQDLRNATTMEQQLLATEALKQLRSSYGSFAPQNVPGSTDAGGQTVYQQALNDAAAPESTLAPTTPQTGFQYDAQQDPSYEALKKSYLREGDRARAETMAQASAATGGVPSSYAVTAASQAGDYYSTQLADAVPTLEMNAYQKYLNQYAQDKETAQMLAAKGDFSRLAQLLGLSDEEVALLQRKGGGNPVPKITPGTIPDYMLEALKSNYPDGKVTDLGYWNSLLGMYDPEALAAAGYTYVDQKTEENKQPSKGGGGRGGQMYVKQ